MTATESKRRLPKLALAAMAGLAASACTPPTNIFTPETGTHFNAGTGTVVVQGLTASTALCYTTDGSEPTWNNGACGGSGTQRVQGPITFAQIALTCGSDTGSSVSRTVKALYDWSGTPGYTQSATYTLNCGVDDGGTGGDGSSAAGSDTMAVGQVLNANEYLVSANGDYRFYLQTDGNLVLRDWQTRESLWSSGTHRENGTQLRLQSDGNLVLYTDTGTAVWASNTVGSGADQLLLNNEGTLGLYQGSSDVWSVGESGSDGGSDGGAGGSGSITHVGTTEVYDSNGENMTISRPSGSTTGDLLVLFLHRTDDYLPLNVAGWNRAAQCYKRDNGYDCVAYEDCTSWRTADICETFGDYGRAGRDLAQSVFYRRVGSGEANAYTFDLNPDGAGGHPGWAILTALRGANTSDPIRDWDNEGCDNNPDSLFPSVYGVAGDMVLLSQSFDDQIAQSKFNPPDDTTTLGYVSQSDEAGFLFGGVLDSSGETGSMKTHGDGGPNCKDALVSLTIKAD